jgi:hypothetical protein
VRFPVRVERFAVPGEGSAGAFLDDLGMLEAPRFVTGQPGGLVKAEDSTCSVRRDISLLPSFQLLRR